MNGGEAPADLRLFAQPAAHGDVAPRLQGRDELGKMGQVGGEVGVHVADYVGMAVQPRRPQCPSPALLRDA